MTKQLIIMRGLPSCGKSTTAKEIAGTTGLIFSADQYFYTEVDAHLPDVYSFKGRYLAYAHKWAFWRACLQLNMGHPLVIIDNTNTTASEAKEVATYAFNQDYEIVVQEPKSPHWLEIRELLKDRKTNRDALNVWAGKLAKISADVGHNVPEFVIGKMMWRWQNDLTAEQILEAPDFAGT